eukprot:scaffold293735_cov18-Prasinocladus_malaysianus.AAC.1
MRLLAVTRGADWWCQQACCLEGSRRDAEGMPDMLFCSIHGASPPEEQVVAMFPGTARQTQVIVMPRARNG